MGWSSDAGGDRRTRCYLLENRNGSRLDANDQFSLDCHTPSKQLVWPNVDTFVPDIWSHPISFLHLPAAFDFVNSGAGNLQLDHHISSKRIGRNEILSEDIIVRVSLRLRLFVLDIFALDMGRLWVASRKFLGVDIKRSVCVGIECLYAGPIFTLRVAGFRIYEQHHLFWHEPDCANSLNSFESTVGPLSKNTVNSWKMGSCPNTSHYPYWAGAILCEDRALANVSRISDRPLKLIKPQKCSFRDPTWRWYCYNDGGPAATIHADVKRVKSKVPYATR